MVVLLGFDFFNANPHRPPEPQTERYVTTTQQKQQQHSLAYKARKYTLPYFFSIPLSSLNTTR